MMHFVQFCKVKSSVFCKRSPPPNKLHYFATNSRLYTCELLVWLCVMFQSVLEVKVLYVLLLSDHDMCFT